MLDQKLYEIYIHISTTPIESVLKIARWYGGIYIRAAATSHRNNNISLSDFKAINRILITT